MWLSFNYFQFSTVGIIQVYIGNNNLIKIKLKLLFFIEMLNSIIT